MEQENICTIFNALSRATIKFLKKEYTIIFYYKIDGNAWKPVENGTIMYLHSSMNSNTSDIAQKMVMYWIL